MSGRPRGYRRGWVYSAVAAATVAGTIDVSRADDPLLQGSAMYTAGMPTGTSPDDKMNQYAVAVYYFLNGKDFTGGLGMVSVPVPNIPVTAGLPTPTAAQVAAASAAKAKAIVDAINGAKLPGVSAAIDANTLVGQFPTGKTEDFTSPLTKKTYPRPLMANADFSTYTVSGVRQSVSPDNGLPGEPVIKTAVDPKGKPSLVNVTGESGNSKGNFKPNGKAGAMFQGVDRGTGALTSLASGLDASGFQSSVGFGFIDETSGTPTNFFSSIDPMAGMTDKDVFGSLADEFNAQFASKGYSATYNQITDTLSIDQLLPAVDMVWNSDTDTGLDFESDTVTVAPEPMSLSLLLMGGAALLLRRRCRG